MLEWVKAGYSPSNMQPSSVITDLRYMESKGRYHIFEMANGRCVTIFDNQRNLLDFVHLNMGSIFMLGFLFEDNSIYSYPYVFSDGVARTVLTVARACVLVQGTTETPRQLRYDSSDLLVIE